MRKLTLAIAMAIVVIGSGPANAYSAKWVWRTITGDCYPIKTEKEECRSGFFKKGDYCCPNYD